MLNVLAIERFILKKSVFLFEKSVFLSGCVWED